MRFGAAWNSRLIEFGDVQESVRYGMQCICLVDPVLAGTCRPDNCHDPSVLQNPCLLQYKTANSLPGRGQVRLSCAGIFDAVEQSALSGAVKRRLFAARHLIVLFGQLVQCGGELFFTRYESTKRNTLSSRSRPRRQVGSLIAIITAASTISLRIIGYAMPMLMGAAVVVTANHYRFDPDAYRLVLRTCWWG